MADATMGDRLRDLDRFKRRLIKTVARLKENDEPDLWGAVEKALGKDCKDMWSLMRTLVLKKLSRLLRAGDLAMKLAPASRMTITDWLLVDLVLVHEDIDTITIPKSDVQPPQLADLLELVREFNLERCPKESLAERWTEAAMRYSKYGRMCSPMLLQRRWYELKLQTRNKFYNYWRVFRKPHNEKVKPTKLHIDVAIQNNSIITAELPTWQELVKQGLVILPQFLAKKPGSKSQSKESASNDTDDVVLIEPVIETIDVDLENELEKEVAESDLINDTENAKSLNGDEIISEPIICTDMSNVRYEHKIDDVNFVHNINNVPKNCAEHLGENTENKINPTVVEVRKEETSNVVIKDEILISDIPIYEDPAFQNENSPENNNYGDNTESSLEAGGPESATLPVILKVETLAQEIQCDFGNTSSDIDTVNVILTKSDDHPIQKNVTSYRPRPKSKRLVPTPEPLIEAVNEQFTCSKGKNKPGPKFTKGVSYSETEKLLMDNEINCIIIPDESDVEEVNSKKIEEACEVKRTATFQELTSELDECDFEFADEDDEIDLATLKSLEQQHIDTVNVVETVPGGIKEKSTEASLISENEDSSQDDSNTPKFDLKLLMLPVVYTSKLEDMCILKNVDLESTVLGNLVPLDTIETQSKPKSEGEFTMDDDNFQTLDSNEHNNSDFYAGECLNNDETEEFEETIQSATMIVKENSYIFQKPRVRTYTPVNLCKNPDFNTRLRRLSVAFLMMPRNRQLLKACKPLTIDLQKSFEEKLVDGVVRIQTSSPEIADEILIGDFDNQKSEVMPSVMSIQSLMNNEPMNIKSLVERPNKLPELDIELLRARKNKSIQLLDREKVRLVNKQLKTAQVPPLIQAPLVETSEKMQNDIYPQLCRSQPISQDGLNQCISLLEPELIKNSQSESQSPLSENNSNYKQEQLSDRKTAIQSIAPISLSSQLAILPDVKPNIETIASVVPLVQSSQKDEVWKEKEMCLRSELALMEDIAKSKDKVLRNGVTAKQQNVKEKQKNMRPAWYQAHGAKTNIPWYSYKKVHGTYENCDSILLKYDSLKRMINVLTFDSVEPPITDTDKTEKTNSLNHTTDTVTRNTCADNKKKIIYCCQKRRHMLLNKARLRLLKKTTDVIKAQRYANPLHIHRCKKRECRCCCGRFKKVTPSSTKDALNENTLTLSNPVTMKNNYASETIQAVAGLALQTDQGLDPVLGPSVVMATTSDISAVKQCQDDIVIDSDSEILSKEELEIIKFKKTTAKKIDSDSEILSKEELEVTKSKKTTVKNHNRRKRKLKKSAHSIGINEHEMENSGCNNQIDHECSTNEIDHECCTNEIDHGVVKKLKRNPKSKIISNRVYNSALREWESIKTTSKLAYGFPIARKVMGSRPRLKRTITVEISDDDSQTEMENNGVEVNLQEHISNSLSAGLPSSKNVNFKGDELVAHRQCTEDGSPLLLTESQKSSVIEVCSIAEQPIKVLPHNETTINKNSVMKSIDIEEIQSQLLNMKKISRSNLVEHPIKVYSGNPHAVDQIDVENSKVSTIPIETIVEHEISETQLDLLKIQTQNVDYDYRSETQSDLLRIETQNVDHDYTRSDIPIIQFETIVKDGSLQFDNEEMNAKDQHTVQLSITEMDSQRNVNVDKTVKTFESSSSDQINVPKSDTTDVSTFGTGNSILSDLMEISGISTDDTLVPCEVTPPISVNNSSPIVLTQVSTHENGIIATSPKGKYYLCNKDTGEVTPLTVVKVTPLTAKTPSPSKMVPAVSNCEPELIPIDKEISSQTYNSPQYKHTPNILKKRQNLYASIGKRRRPYIYRKFLSEYKIKKRKGQLEAKIDLVDSDDPMTEEYLIDCPDSDEKKNIRPRSFAYKHSHITIESDSSDDEPLSVIARKKTQGSDSATVRVYGGHPNKSDINNSKNKIEVDSINTDRDLDDSLVSKDFEELSTNCETAEIEDSSQDCDDNLILGI